MQKAKIVFLPAGSPSVCDGIFFLKPKAIYYSVWQFRSVAFIAFIHCSGVDVVCRTYVFHAHSAWFRLWFRLQLFYFHFSL